MQVLDRYVVSLVPLSTSMILAAGGSGQTLLATVPAGEIWEVERIAVDGAGAAAIISIYGGLVSIGSLREAGQGNRMVADEASPVRFFGSENIIFVITSGTGLAQVGINAQVQSVVWVPREIGIAASSQAMSTHLGAKDPRPGQGVPEPVGWN